MIGKSEEFRGAGEGEQALGIGMTKSYEIIRTFNREVGTQGFWVIRGRCPRKYFEQKVYGYAECYNPVEDLEKDAVRE